MASNSVVFSIFIFCITNSFAVGQMSASLSGGSVTQWMTVGMDQMNLLTAVSTMLFQGWFKIVINLNSTPVLVSFERYWN